MTLALAEDFAEDAPCTEQYELLSSQRPTGADRVPDPWWVKAEPCERGRLVGARPPEGSGFACMRHRKNDGRASVFDPQGRVIEESTFVDGQENGVRYTWDVTGRLTSQVAYVDGKKEGLSVMWSPSGEVSVSTWAHGLRYGPSYSFSASGPLKMVINYLADEPVGRGCTWSTDGQVVRDWNP